MSRNLVLRIAFAGVAIPLAILGLYSGGWMLASLLALLGVLGTREVYGLARRQGIATLGWMGYLGAAAIPLAVQSGWTIPGIFAGAIWMLVVMTAALATRTPQEKPLSSVAVTVFGAVYASGLLAFVIPLRAGGHPTPSAWGGTWIVLLPLVATWICDTAAMAAGSWIGGPKLAPVVSPKKTWAGAVGGMIGALGASLAVGLLILPRVGVQFDIPLLVGVGAVVGVVAQVGDVAESLFKREVGVKDSSTIIPGHGGVLDRLDSLYFVLPATSGLLKLFGAL